MRVGFLANSVSRKAGGLFDANRRVAQELISLGNIVETFGLEDDQTEADRSDWSPIKVNTSQTFGPRQIGFSPRLARLIDKFSPDVLHAHGLWQGVSITAKRWGQMTKKPVIIHPHGMLDPWAIRNSAWKKRLAGLLFEYGNLRTAKCIRALCESEANSIRSFGLKNPIAIIPNGVDLTNGESTGYQCYDLGNSNLQHHFESESNEMTDKKKLLYLGRIHPKKGLANLLTAWNEAMVKWKAINLEIPRPGMQWQLCIAGWNERGHEQELKQLAQKLSISWCDLRDNGCGSKLASLVFMGPQFKNDKAFCYRKSDAFVLPSFSEGLPMVILDAWAYSKPVLMTPHCNLPEGFAAGAAIPIQTKPESITEGLLQLFRLSETDNIRMGKLGRELVLLKFTWQKVAKQFHDVSHWAIHGGTPPKCIRFD
jgi:glycosyltransferase involved in cell wall biosynthesis